MIRLTAPGVALLLTSLLLTGLLLAAAPVAAQSADGPFAACEEAFAADPQGWKTCGCFYRVTIETGLREEAVARLEAHREADPGKPLPPLHPRPPPPPAPRR